MKKAMTKRDEKKAAIAAASTLLDVVLAGTRFETDDLDGENFQKFVELGRRALYVEANIKAIEALRGLKLDDKKIAPGTRAYIASVLIQQVAGPLGEKLGVGQGAVLSREDVSSLLEQAGSRLRELKAHGIELQFDTSSGRLGTAVPAPVSIDGAKDGDFDL